MSIVVRETPVRKRAGRPCRISDEDLKDLAETVKAGDWGGDDEAAPSKSAAYQRAGTAKRKLGGEPYNLVDLETSAVPVDAAHDQNSDPHYWLVGPVRADSPRRRRRNGSS